MANLNSEALRALLSAMEDAGDTDAGTGNEPRINSTEKFIRIESMARELLDELHRSRLDAESRSRLRQTYEATVKELGDALSPDAAEELFRLTIPFSHEAPSHAELRTAQGQLVGWLGGIFRGTQAMLVAQQIVRREDRTGQMQRSSRSRDEDASSRGGTYL
jgi:hypothetical protein